MTQTVREVCDALAARSDSLAMAARAINFEPYIRQRPAGYAGLFRIIVEQQVSVPSAQAILARCEARIPEISVQKVISMSEDDLRACGLSRPKVRYVKGAAQAVLDQSLRFEQLPELEDEAAVAHLCAVKGVGPWTAAIYLLFCEGRLDIWPRNDVALLAAYAAASGFASKPAQKDFDLMASTQWAPWRGMAAHILWTYYAKLRGRKPI
ncbi:DNA-3-methyladenine glycosylase [Parvularcula sp. IMCC14364]|uniref:DNA-3-methyladenine glycosylase family protein n=1 Tax=Parvularcula sp. IMCC14364 TaxID=3067902 RepID=UPI0027406C14|nr:hypothetical protein [Parvularcula sp. IMCC14364]